MIEERNRILSVQGGGFCRACQGAVQDCVPGGGQRKGGREVRSGAWGAGQNHQ